ncbi:antibiotic biosynthesis monooxygenase family protein [Marinicrinis sediminis]|uniref:Antibiotic biosynthesis monooxygenase family protein n=1 Tax=Marinicrinis sediminis TaxID=1652465 RepID=A0ABW5RCM8_9BACL
MFVTFSSRPTSDLTLQFDLIEGQEPVYVQEHKEMPADNADGDQTFQVIDHTGDFPAASAFAVINNIPVTPEGREAFEERFLNRARMIEEEPGFRAIRVLRPLQGDTYRILTFWETEADFANWQQSKAYEKAHQKRHTPQGMDQQKPSIFAGASFVTKYHVQQSEEV